MSGGDFPHHLFKEYDIRGVVDSDLDVAMAEKIGRALASQARAQGIGELTVGRDGRISGAAISDAVMRGIAAAGCDVCDIGMVATPVLYFAAAKRSGNDRGGGKGSGVQVTASHNPPQYNGMKMMLGGVTLFGDAIQAIKNRVIENNFIEGAGKIHRTDALGEYHAALVADIKLRKLGHGLKIVIDCGNGVAAVAAAQIFRAIGCEVVELFCEVDGNFPNHDPDPSCPQNLRDLIEAVCKHNADLGLAFDGDGDRLGVVSSVGEIIWPDRLMTLFAADILASHPHAEIIFDVKCSRLLPRAIEAGGGVAVMCKTGHSFIKNTLKKSGAPFAGEMSGHLFFNDRWGGFDDGLYAGARLCELLSADPRPPHEVFAALPDSVNTPELRLPMAEGEAHQLVAELVANAAAFNGGESGKISTIDGLRVDFDAPLNGFGLIRASNTTPSLIMRFEADSEKNLQAIQMRFRELINAVRGGLELPF